MSLPRVALHSLRGFLGAIACRMTTSVTTNLLLHKLQGALTESDADVQTVVNAAIDALDDLKGTVTALPAIAPSVINRTTNGTLVGSKYAIASARWTILNLEIPLASGGNIVFYAQLPAAPTEGDIVDVKALMEISANEWSALLNIDGNGKTIEKPAHELDWDHTGALSTVFHTSYAPGGRRNMAFRLTYVGGRWRVSDQYAFASASHIYGKWIDLSNGGGVDASTAGDALAVNSSDEFVPYSLVKGRVSKGQATFDGDFTGIFGTSNSYSKDGHVYGKTTNATVTTLCTIASLPNNSRVDVLVTFNAINVSAAATTDTMGVDCRAKFWIDNAGVVTQKGATVQANLDTDVTGTWDATIDNTAGGMPRLRVTGQAATNIQWDAEITIIVRTITDGP